MKVSIITVCYNSAGYIHTCIDSVVNQTYKDIEFIIIDGVSKDNTMEIVRSYGDKITQVVSEKDKGIYDAMNKGIGMATGEIVAILNSDDLYYDNQVIENVVNAFKMSKAGALYADIVYINDGDLNTVVRYYSGKTLKLSDLAYGLAPPHPAFFALKKCYDDFGTFHLKYPICADYDLMVRLMYVHKVPTTYLPLITTKMRTGGNSSLSFRNVININKERKMSCKENNIPTNYFKLYVKYIEKFFQLFKRPKLDS